MAYGSDPTVRSWLLGAKLKQARDDKGLSVKEVAAQAERAESTIYRNESGHTAVNKTLVEFYINLYKPRRSDADHWRYLASHSRQRGPWGPSGRIVGPTYRDFADAEAMADVIMTWNPQAVPGLMQTTDYSKTVIGAAAEAYPAGSYPADQYMELREQRKGLLSLETRPRMSVVMDQGALERVIGGPKVMLEQVSHLHTISSQSRTSIRVLPYEAGSHAGLSGGFTIFRFGRDAIVFREGHGDGTFLDDAEQIEIYVARYELLQNKAWSDTQSRRYLREQRGSLIAHDEGSSTP
ncbi:Scr1 family TA system antitoxin-like transcriptional regulator [Streptomyces sp. NPDC088727]|uniref:helix-turn-helix domain-containing protein n=1 Tax=Streptomyces sp. NPDC088727 TaxID=3365875 RepID=UPI0037F56DBD